MEWGGRGGGGGVGDWGAESGEANGVSPAGWWAVGHWGRLTVQRGSWRSGRSGDRLGNFRIGSRSLLAAHFPRRRRAPGQGCANLRENGLSRRGSGNRGRSL